MEWISLSWILTLSLILPFATLTLSPTHSRTSKNPRSKRGERLEKGLEKMKERKRGTSSAAAHGHPSPLNPFMVSLRRIISISWVILWSISLVWCKRKPMWSQAKFEFGMCEWRKLGSSTFYYGSSQISELWFYTNLIVYPQVLVSLSLILRALATVSKTSSNPSYLEPSELPKLS